VKIYYSVPNTQLSEAPKASLRESPSDRATAYFIWRFIDFMDNNTLKKRKHNQSPGEHIDMPLISIIIPLGLFGTSWLLKKHASLNQKENILMKATVIIQLKFNQTVFIVCLLSTLLFANYQANAQWTQLSSGVNDDLYGVYFHDSANGYAVGWGSSAGGIALKTTDGGESWNSTILASGAFVFSITFTDTLHGFAAGSLNGGAAGAVFKTANGGNSWSYSTMSSTFGLYDVEFPTSETGYACGWLGKIYKTTNEGSTWSTLNSSTSNVLRWMHFQNDSTGYIVGGTNWNNPNMLHKTTNGGNSWSMIHVFSGAVIGGIHFFNSDTGVVCGGSGEFINKTYDGGATWEAKYSNSSGLFQSLQFSDDGIGYACGNGGQVIKSEDFGETWIEMEPVVPSTTLLCIYGVEGVVYAVGTSGRIFKNVTVTGVDPFNEELLPTKISLYQNYPNPFNPSTIISYQLPEEADVKLEIYNTLGQKVSTLVNTNVEAGYHQVVWDGKDQLNREVSSGIYLYLIQAGNYNESRKMVLIR